MKAAILNLLAVETDKHVQTSLVDQNAVGDQSLILGWPVLNNYCSVTYCMFS